jgi:hypothetical protein
VGTGAKEDESITGLFDLLDYTVFHLVLTWQAFLNLLNVYFLNFPIFSGRAEALVTETLDME